MLGDLLLFAVDVILTPMTTHTRRLLLATVFLTGGAVLIFEVGAMRLLAPYYGSSLTVVSSVLSVILLALSLGYYFGGRLADRYPAPALLSGVITTAGILMLGLLLSAHVYFPTLAPVLGYSAGPLILSAFCFFLPALLLGVDSPFVSKLLASGTNTEGEVVGTVFFLSTIGSITGSFLAGFYLIPYFGLTNTLSAVALVLVGWGILLFLATRTRTPLTTPTIIIIGSVICVSIVLVTLIWQYPPTSRGTLLHSQDGLYSQMLVYDETIRGTTYRFLKNDTNFSSAIIPDSAEVVFPYAEVALQYRDMVPDANSYLVLGGGAYTIPRHVHLDNPDITIDTVELEPFLLPIAHTYFELPIHERLRNHTQDARVYLSTATTTYDVIFSDVMNSGHYTPPHLLTVEFFTSLRARLAPGGVAFLNYIGSLDTRGVSMTGSLIRTLTSVFPNYQLLPVYSPTEKKLQNIIIIVRHEDTPIRFADDTSMKNRIYAFDYALNERLMTIDQDELSDERIFTDDVPGIEPLQARQFRLHQ